VRRTLSVSERRACAALGQHRSTQRKAPWGHDDEERLTADLIELARQYGRYGYREITALLRDAGWLVNDKRVERIWRREGLKVPPRQPKRGRLSSATDSMSRRAVAAPGRPPSATARSQTRLSCQQVRRAERAAISGGSVSAKVWRWQVLPRQRKRHSWIRSSTTWLCEGRSSSSRR
jgi:hypothetical protein